MIKICNKCNFQGENSLFRKDRNICKACDKVRKDIWYANNKDKRKISTKAYYEANREIYKVKKRIYQQANLAKYCAIVNKYRAAKLNATPKWLTKEQLKEIEKIYESCPKGYHVDHILPLQGETVSGLHVPWNLQLLPASKNIQKSNKV